MHVDTAVRLLITSGKFYFHGSLARVNGGFDAVKMDMCALPSGLLILCPVPAVSPLLPCLSRLFSCVRCWQPFLSFWSRHSV